MKGKYSLTVLEGIVEEVAEVIVMSTGELYFT